MTRSEAQEPEAPQEAPAEEAPQPTHEPVPADCTPFPSTADGLNHLGCFRRPAGEDQPEGSTIVIKSHATEDNLANHEREGVMEFLGYVGAPSAPAVADEPAPEPRPWRGKTYDIGQADADPGA